MNEVKRYKLLQSVCYDDGAFVIPAGQVMVTASAHDDVVQALRAENARLKEAVIESNRWLEIALEDETLSQLSVQGLYRRIGGNKAALQPERGKP